MNHPVTGVSCFISSCVNFTSAPVLGVNNCVNPTLHIISNKSAIWRAIGEANIAVLHWQAQFGSALQMSIIYCICIGVRYGFFSMTWLSVTPFDLES